MGARGAIVGIAMEIQAAFGDTGPKNNQTILLTDSKPKYVRVCVRVCMCVLVTAVPVELEIAALRF